MVAVITVTLPPPSAVKENTTKPSIAYIYGKQKPQNGRCTKK